MVFSLSFHQQANAAHRDHNIRNINAVGAMEHIDHAYSGENIILRDIKIRDAYELAFGDSTRRFREKQIKNKVRKDRIVGDYYNAVKKNAKLNLCYEVILQIGDRDTVGWRLYYRPGAENSVWQDSESR